MRDRTAVFTIPSHRSFADALAAGLIAQFGKEPLGLAQGRILLPNNRAVRAVTEAFVRQSGSGLLLPRLIPVGDPELDERVSGAIDLAERRNRLLAGLAGRWKDEPPGGFTVAAGITTAAPAIAALVARVARMPGGMVVLPGLWLDDVFPDEEWDALGPDEDGRGDATHPQFHLKLLLDRLGIGREEVGLWRRSGDFASSPARGRAVANAMAAA